MPFNISNPQTLNLLKARRSVKGKAMIEPGPDSDQLKQILSAAIRVPDHGKLGPWRFIVLEDDDRTKLGALISEGLNEEGDASPKVCEKMAGYATQGPTLIIAISSPVEHRAIPVFEQQLSMGAACQTLLIAAHAMGFVGQWLTGWAATSETVRSGLDIKAHERIAGFIFLGSQDNEPSERPRPNFDDKVQWGLRAQRAQRTL